MISPGYSESITELDGTVPPKLQVSTLSSRFRFRGIQGMPAGYFDIFRATIRMDLAPARDLLPNVMRGILILAWAQGDVIA